MLVTVSKLPQIHYEVARNQKVTKDSRQLIQESADLTQESPQSIPVESEAKIKSPIDNILYILVICSVCVTAQINVLAVIMMLTYHRC